LNKKQLKELEFQKKWAKIFPQNKSKIRQYWKKFRCLDKIVKECEISSVSKIMDIGCGLSSVLHFIPGMEKVALDPLIDEYKKIYKYPKDFTLTNSCNFQDYFDVIFCSNVLDHITEHEKMLEKIYLALAKNGYFILTINIFEEKKDRDEAHPHCFTRHDIWDLIKKKFHILYMEENDWYGLKNFVEGKKDIYGKELILILQKMGT